MMKILSKYIYFFCLVIGSENLLAQPIAIAPAQSQKTILIGGIIHIGNGKVLNNGALIFENGIITFCGDITNVKLDMSNALILEANGQHIYPGLIDAYTQLGLDEVGAVRATQDAYEVGSLNPNIRSIISYNTDSRIIPTMTTNGILLSNIVPTGDMVGGLSSVVQHNAWNYEDAAYIQDLALNIHWMPRPIAHNDEDVEKIELALDKFHKAMNALELLFADAKNYCNTQSTSVNIKLEAMCDVLKGTRRLIIYVDKSKDIIDAITFSKKWGITPVIAGASDAWMITDYIKSQGVSVILGKTHALPNRVDEEIDMAYRMPSILQGAGILYCISMINTDVWNHRNLPFQAGQAVAYGIDKEQALQSITLSVAQILGIEKRTGSLEVGKDANIIISKGDILDMRTSQLTSIFIQGRNINIENPQIYQYQRYMDKYNLKEK